LRGIGAQTWPSVYGAVDMTTSIETL
jgi:hypothetical protein